MNENLSHYDILQREFNGETGSFLIQLRCDFHWDKLAFQRLIKSMYAVAQELENQENLPKWVANGFWYVEWFCKSWTTHENFPAPEQDYHICALETLHDLCHYLFVGEKVEIDFDSLKSE